MDGVGRRLIGVLFAAGLALGLLGGAAFAGSGSGGSQAGTVSSGVGPDGIRLVQTQETTPPTPENETRRPCPNKNRGATPGTTPGTTPNDTSV